MSEDKKFEDLPLAEQIDKWQEAAKFARRWAQIELSMRAHIFSTNFKDPKVGTNKMKLDKYDDGEQLALVGTHKISYSVDKDGWLAAVKDKLIPGKLADEMVSWSPKLIESAYKALDKDGDEIKLVAPFITEKPATPTIEVKLASKIRW